jgi:hypothetical protein
MTGGRAAGMSAEMCSKMNFNDGLEFRSLQRTGVTRRLSTDTPGFFPDLESGLFP